MFMKRKIEEKLLKWKKESNGKTALLIDGARRVGKSYIVEEFAKQHYKSYILIDFNQVGSEITDLIWIYEISIVFLCICLLLLMWNYYKNLNQMSNFGI